MTRSVWKGPFVDGYLLKKADAALSSGRKDVIKTWSRRSTIMPQFVGLTFGVHNGQKHIPVSVSEDMVGMKFGEFAHGPPVRGQVRRIATFGIAQMMHRASAFPVTAGTGPIGSLSRVNSGLPPTAALCCLERMRPGAAAPPPKGPPK